LLTKLIRKYIPSDSARQFLTTAYAMSLDMYKTFAPIKQTTFTMALSIVELTARLTGTHEDAVRALPARENHTDRGAVVETMLDLLDLYAQFHKSTKVGVAIDHARFIAVKIALNEEVEATRALARFAHWCERCEADEPPVQATPTPGSATTSPATTGSGRRGGKAPDGTLRYVFDTGLVRAEQRIVGEYFKEEFEEYEVEVEERIPTEPTNNHGNHHRHGPSHRDDRHNHHNSGWAPYSRGPRHHGDHRSKRGRY
jgi:CTD kinase subunit beta